MRSLLPTYVALLLLVACHKPAEPISISGFVHSADEEQLTLTNDSIPSRRFLIAESTLIEGGEMAEGNIVEVIYLPSEVEGSTPTALHIITDKTYTESLGRWATEGESRLPIDITLLPHGRIEQSQPNDILRFERWELTAEEGTISLHGVISLPPDYAARAARLKAGEELEPPTRRERHFTVTARLDKQSDNNTESRRVMIFSTEDDQTKLYFQQ
ncbi:MAG: hypothetical protein IKK27_02590 [Alistipes sp.]|nr:hypothetical protein [Alistipes sp.]MBR7115413.1 hypothetical protein [Alistipes sp.]